MHSVARGSSDVDLFRRFPLVYTELNSVQDTIVLAGVGVGGTTTALGAMTFKELF